MPGGRAGDGMGVIVTASIFKSAPQQESITLNLSILRLWRSLSAGEDADVVVENYRPDVKKRWGSTTTSCVRSTHDHLWSISGFGQEGLPRPAGVDQIARVWAD